jgi:NodT family efflux transporter outer membrane factor (OMF) lipoprotein
MSLSMNNRRVSAWLAGAGAAATLAGCTVGPDYHRPSAPTTPQFKEAQGWRPSTPADTIDRGAWWSMYGDETLDSLERRVATSNQTVKQFEAAYRQSTQIVKEAKAAAYPTIGASLSTARGSGGSGSGSASSVGTGSALGSPNSTTSTTSSGFLEATWVPDLWGKVRRTVESDKALAQASAAEIANARLAAQAALAEDYFELRVLDEEADLFRSTVADDQQFLQLTEFQYQAGTQSESAVVAAKTQLLTAQSALIALGTARAQMEHAIAVLVGVPPADLTIPPAKLSHRVPVVPAGVPSALLERRPDIAAAERTMASANAQIGVAISAYYPDITLSASAGGSSLGSLAGGGMGLWSIGAALGETILDFGQRKAQVGAARATYDQDVAAYRQTVLTAFQGVEDELAALRIFQQQEEVALQAEAEAHKAVELDIAQYKAGTVDYTTVLVAQTAELAASQTVLTILQQRLQASVLLVENLGGGWNASELPKS